MSPDAGPNYTVERKRLQLQKLEHEQTIESGRARLLSIDRQKAVNIARAELANDELDSEADIIMANEEALKKAMGEIDKKIVAMTKETG